MRSLSLSICASLSLRPEAECCRALDRLLHKISKYGTDGVCKEEARRALASGAAAAERPSGSEAHPWAALDIVMDCVVISVMVYVGVVPQHNNDPAVVSLHLLQGAYAAAALNRAMLTYEK